MNVTDIQLASGFNARRLRANLARNDAAIQALAALGIDRAAVAAFGLGMKEPYCRADGVTVAGVVTYPIESRGGRCRYGYLNLEPITVCPEHNMAWSPGDAREVRCGGGGTLIVAASPITVFQVRTVIESKALPYEVIASSQPDIAPVEWDDAAYWAKHDRVILCGDVPASLVARIRRIARRPLERSVRIEVSTSSPEPMGTQMEVAIEEFVALATPLTEGGVHQVDDGFERSGDFAATPIPLHGGFSRGYLYYPFLVERRRKAAGGSRLLHSYETLVLRSDGAILEAHALPSPPGVAAGRRVYALTDGTRIGSMPAPSSNATWRLDAIQAFAAARSAGSDPCRRPAREVLADVRDLLAARVWLPEADDYWVVAAFVVMSHMFRAFRSLPILLVTGPHGTGKSELAAGMVDLGFNAVMMGQGSAAALIRLSRECGGLVVLDDAEGLGTTASGFNELSQCLKVGYRAETARKAITQSSGKVETYDFFGPRVITCTSGIDPVLESRCISIRSSVREAPSSSPDRDVDARDLRDELHALAMCHARDVHAEYERRMTESTDRTDEIWAPLMAIAQVMGCRDALAALGRRRPEAGERLTH